MTVFGGAVSSKIAEPPTTPTRRANPFGWRFWLGIAVSALFLYLSLKGQPFGQIWAALKLTRWRWLGPAIALFFVRVGFAGWRWHFLLRSTKNVPLRRLWPINMIGFAANNVLPLRAGEVVRIWTLSTQENIGKSAVLATLVIERIFDGLTLLLLTVLATVFIPVTPRVHTLTVLSAAIFISALVLFCLIAFSSAWQRRLLRPALRMLPEPLAVRMERRFLEFVDGLGSLRRLSDMSMVAFTSIGSWIAEVGTYIYVARALHFDLSFSAALLTMGVANIFTLIPSSPGYVGPFEAGTLLVLQQIMKVAPDVSVAYALLIHATLYFPVTIVGLYYMVRQHLSLSKMDQMRDFAAKAEAEAAAQGAAELAAVEAGGHVAPERAVQ